MSNSAGSGNSGVSEGRKCKYGDPFCPCQDGDMCHYEGVNPMKSSVGVEQRPAQTYWIVEWRFPAANGKPAGRWLPIDRAPFLTKKAALDYKQRDYYDYQITESVAASADVRELREALQAIATSGKSLTMGDVREIARAVLKKHGAGTL